MHPGHPTIRYPRSSSRGIFAAISAVARVGGWYVGGHYSAPRYWKVELTKTWWGQLMPMLWTS